MAVQLAPPTVQGQLQSGTVPDTLDLAERARVALNVLTKNPEPSNYYRIWQGMQLNTNPAHLSGPNWLTYKFLESLPFMRAMCGDEMNLDVEADMMRVHVERIAEDGLAYEPPGTSSFMRSEGASPFTNARLMLAMLAWHQRDGDSAWLTRVERMNTALAALTIKRHHYAFHPSEAVHAPGKGWLYTSRGGVAHFPYTPPDEPSREQQGLEGTIKENAHALRAAVRTYEFTGDPAALDYARRMAEFYMLPSFWEDGAPVGITGAEHGLFAGHFHGNVGGLRGILRLGIVARDERLKHFVREGYEFARAAGVPRMGWFPGWISPERFGRSRFFGTICEGCGIADMVAVAVKLSDAGIGDYWDDVDAIARNQLIEQQGVDRGLLEAASAAGKPFQPRPGSESTIDRAIERSLGGFAGFGEPTCIPGTDFHGCCTGNGTQALFYAWEGITRFDGTAAQVNLLLNRASAWLDVDSYLPYEGKVVITNKQATTISVRIPGWVDRRGLTFRLNDQAVTPFWSGNYVVFGGVGPGDVVTLAFAVPEQTNTYTAGGGSRYTITWRGSTVVDISPRHSPVASYPLYQRDHLKADRAPTRQTTRFVADRVPSW